MIQSGHPPQTQAIAVETLSVIANLVACGPEVAAEPGCIPALVALLSSDHPAHVQTAAARTLFGICTDADSIANAVSAVFGSVEALAVLVTSPEIPEDTKEAAANALAVLVSLHQRNKDAFMAVNGRLQALVAQLGPGSPPKLQASAAHLLGHLANGCHGAQISIAAADGCISALVALISSTQDTDVACDAAFALRSVAQVG
jgi:hypothetical protein